jgi:hypothetical protein
MGEVCVGAADSAGTVYRSVVVICGIRSAEAMYMKFPAANGTRNATSNLPDSAYAASAPTRKVSADATLYSSARRGFHPL